MEEEQKGVRGKVEEEKEGQVASGRRRRWMDRRVREEEDEGKSQL